MELNWSDKNIGVFGVSPSGEALYTTINALTQGRKEGERIGRTATIKSIAFHYTVSLPNRLDQSAATIDDVIRIIVYLDKQCNGVTATYSDVVNTSGGGPEFREHMNLSNEQRFDILLDRWHNISRPAITSENVDEVTQVGTVKFFNWYYNCNIKIEYSGTSNLISDIASNNIGAVVCSINGTGTISCTARIRYTDN